MSPFGDRVTTLLSKRGLSQTAFGARVGMSQSHIAHILRGQARMPMRRIDTWADALGLAGAARRRFRLEALLTRCPAEVRAYVYATLARPERQSRAR